jgi:hypothetical protein
MLRYWYTTRSHELVERMVALDFDLQFSVRASIYDLKCYTDEFLHHGGRTTMGFLRKEGTLHPLENMV